MIVACFPLSLIEVLELAGPSQPERIAALQAEQAYLDKRLAILEERSRPRDRNPIATIIAAILALAVSGLGCWGWNLSQRTASIETKLGKLEQKLADGGFGSIVGLLNDPKSPAALKAGLSTVVAQVLTARANSVKPDSKKVEALSSAVAQVINKNETLPEAWQAAGELISYQTMRNESNLPTICSMENATYVGGYNIPPYVGIKFEKCTVIIDDAPQLEHPISTMLQKYPDSFLRFDNVHIIYNGGRLPPVKNFAFINCSFDFRINSRPVGNGANFTEKLLIAADKTSLSISPA